MAKVHIFMDNSNLFISARRVCSFFERYCMQYKVRLHFQNLMELAAYGREIAQSVAVGSTTFKDNTVWSSMAYNGIHTETYERGAYSGSEQAVDQTLQLAMYRSLCNYRPETVCLLTGDGEGFERGEGFLMTLHDMYKGGWGIEVLAWEHTCNHELKNFATRFGVFIPLEDYYDSVTYTENSRYVSPLSIKNRPVAVHVEDESVNTRYWVPSRRIEHRSFMSRQKALETNSNRPIVKNYPRKILTKR